MAEQYSIGLESVKMGDVAAGGGYGTPTAFPYSGKGTVKISSTEPEVKEFFAEEVEDPIYSVVTQPSIKTLELAVHDVSPATLQRLLGGELKGTTPEEWEAPDQTPELEQSIEITTLTGHVIKIVRAKVVAWWDWSLSREELAKVSIKCTILAPTDGTSKAYSVKSPTAE